MNKPLRAAAFTLALGAAGFAAAQTEMGIKVGVNYPNGVQFDCNSLYGVTDGDASTAGSTTVGAFRINLETAAPTGNSSVTDTQVFSPTYATGTTNNWGASSFSTAALGPVPADGAIPDSLQMWLWPWNYVAATFNFKYVKQGGMVAYQGGNIPSRPGGDAANYWSGGEFNQMTGELYLSSGEGDHLGYNNTYPVPDSRNTGRIGIYDPSTGTLKISGRLLPRTQADMITVAGDAYMSSDMAIDAQGNVYMIVGNANTNKRLIRIVRSKQETDVWYYNKVAITIKAASPSMGGVMYGSAFLNGKFYFTNGATVNLIELNPLDGTTRNLTMPRGFLDLAACQVAPVIQGVVRNDANGDGTGAGVPGITVDIFKDDGNGNSIYKGTQTTDGSGNYSFITDSPSATYYLRVTQPQIGGINAAQTYASASVGDLDPTTGLPRNTKNITTSFCVDDNGNTQEVTTPGACRGTRFAGSDPASPSASGTAWDITNAQSYSKVVMTTDREVANADFGFSAAASYGDAASQAGSVSSGFKVLLAQGGPFHVVANKYLWLGDTFKDYPDGVADPNTNAHLTDDGIFIQRGGAWIPFQGVALANSKTYKLKAKVNGPLSKQGWLNVSDNTGVGYAVGTRNANLSDPAGSGEIIFDYPSRAATGAPLVIITRFRFSTTKDLPAQSATAAVGAGQQAVGSSANVPWVVDGEVEDYQTVQATAMVHVAVVSQGGTGTFGYSMTNISNSTGTINSTSSANLTTTAPNVRVDESPYASDVLHPVNNWGQAVTITQALPPGKWTPVSVSCMDSVSGASIVQVTGNNAITIPGTALNSGGDVVCLFTNKYAAATAEDSELKVDGPGPAYTTSSALPPNSYTVTVTAKDATKTLQPNAAIAVSVQAGGGTLTGTGSGTFAGGVCTTDASGTCVMTWTSTAPGTPKINATLNGTDIGANAPTPPTHATDVSTCNAMNVCSPQTRQFVNPYLPGQSELAANKTTVTAGGPTVDQATLTVTLKDVSGAITTSVGTTTVNFGSPTPGTFSAPSCDIAQGASSCSVTISSMTTGTAHVTATINSIAVKNSPLDITFQAGAVDINKSALTANPATLVADGASTSSVTATLRDASNN
ncbi:MAG: hypothetical protein LBI48_01420, partial [Burkholderiaceae bacterium]|nr:hypothetical protein [Burkholderiaceae bacterium]